MNDGNLTSRLPAIAHMSFSGDFGGREKVAVTLQKGLRGAGVDCYLYMVVEKRIDPARNANLMKCLGEHDSKWRLFHTDKRFSWRLFKELKNSLIADDVKVVHCHCYKSLFYILLMRMCGLKDVVVLYTLHGLVLEPGVVSTLIQTTQSVGLRMCDGVIGCSREILDSSLPPRWSGKSTTIINAIETSINEYGLLDKLKRTARKRLVELYGLDEAKPIVINVGRLSPQKNFSLYLRMIERLKGKNTTVAEANFLLLGNGSLEEELRQEALSRGIEGDVVFTGFVTDMENAFLGADLLVQTSVWEGTPMCLLEAQSYGLPSVVPAVGGNVDVVTNGENGVLFPVNDLEALMDGVLAYLNDPALRNRNGRKAFDRVKSNFTISAWVEQHIAFYKEIVAARGTKERRG